MDSLAAVADLHSSLDVDDSNELLALAGLSHALAHACAGDFAIAVNRYAPYRKVPQLRPWHAIALGMALDGVGNTAAARELWSSVASRTAWEPYWPEQARWWLAREPTPYH